jgi:nicotinate-nucleotide pyrophosphorylase (carboxylating)
MMVNLPDYITDTALQQLIEAARCEDLGPNGLDVTSQMCVPAELHRQATITARQSGVLAGGALLGTIGRVYDQTVALTCHKQDGDRVQPGDVVATLAGSLRSLLAMERVALNIMGHLSGVATLTDQYVQAVRETRAQILDTRKTLPGLRALQKYAVACGGGQNHRLGLYDAMLIKDNHLTHIPADQLGQTLGEVIHQTRDQHPGLSFIEVEVDTLDQLQQVLDLPIDIALLDNMSFDQISRAVAMRDERGSAIALEASGGVNLQTVGGIAQSGVDRISVGALTHSAAALDFGMDLP